MTEISGTTVYNNMFIKYEGNAVRGALVRQLIQDVCRHNISHKDDLSLQIEVKGL